MVPMSVIMEIMETPMIMFLPTKLLTPQVKKSTPQVLTTPEPATPALKVLVLEPIAGQNVMAQVMPAPVLLTINQKLFTLRQDTP